MTAFSIKRTFTGHLANDSSWPNADLRLWIKRDRQKPLPSVRFRPFPDIKLFFSKLDIGPPK